MSTADKEQAASIVPGSHFAEPLSTADRTQAEAAATSPEYCAAESTMQAFENAIRNACDDILPMGLGYDLVKKDNPELPWGTIRITIEVRQ